MSVVPSVTKKQALRLLAMCMGLWLVGLATGMPIALGDLSAQSQAGLLLRNPLVTPEAQSLVAGQSVREAEQVRLSSPETIVAMEESATKFENISAAEATTVDAEAFPTLADHSEGGPPPLPLGEHIAGFVNGNTALAELSEGQQGVIESSEPMAIAASPEHWAPVDLNLTEADSSIAPSNPLVKVEIPKKLADGIQLPEVGVSVAPVEGSGLPLKGSDGTIDGSVVFYANTLTDTDTIVKPTTLGFDALSILRSVQSPQKLEFKVELPTGASLVQPQGSDAVQVEKEGSTLATIVSPSARDAMGTEVPVTMSISGNNVVVSITPGSSSTRYMYPIAVDPEFNTTTEGLSPGNWHLGETGGYTYPGGVGIKHEGSFPKEDTGYIGMATKGDSSIYEIATHDEVHPLREWPGESRLITYPYMAAWLEIVKDNEKKEQVERHEVTIVEATGLGAPPVNEVTLCANVACSPTGVAEHNVVNFVMTTTESSKFYEENGYSKDLPFSGALYDTTTYLAQPKETHSTVTYNTHSTEIAKQPNVLYGGGAWLGPNSGAFEFTANDKGLGVAGTKLEYDGSKGWEALHNRSLLTEESACKGAQCSESQSEVVNYADMSSLPSGEDRIRVAADDAEPNTWSSEHSEGEALIKVDATKPHGLVLTGLPANHELTEQTYTLVAQATDGSGTTPSSGIASIELAYNGLEVTGRESGSCTPGPCTATGEWKLNGESLGAGKGTLTVIARDNSGNIETKTYEVTVRHSAPIGVGPGSVNPESGDFSMEASDVDISGNSAALAVTRRYDSRNPKTGDEGPLGPQWAISTGSLASLEVLPDGSVMVVSPEGLTHFPVKSGGGFEAPVGDSNLTLSEVTSGGKVVEYLLKNPAKGSTTRFTLPSGAQSWMPTVSEGPIATNTMTDSYKTVEGEGGKEIIEPTLELAPHPVSSCGREQLEKREIAARGCRALEFAYDEKTSAKGENETEWGEYKNRLKEVTLVTYNPTKKEVAGTKVAKYEYDNQGRLRAEWNPEISPSLRTTYGYDAEGHVTSVSPPGQQPWLLRYGTISGDPNTGRLLSVTRPGSETHFGNGDMPADTGGPSLSGSATVGSTLSVSNGTWSSEPLLYSYQWEDCASTCVPIPEANNATYTPTPRDAGYLLLARVTGTNSAGSGESAVSGAKQVSVPAPKYLRNFGGSGEGAGQFKQPTSVAVDGSGNVWVSDTSDARIEEFSASGAFTKMIGWGVSNGESKLEVCTSSCKIGIVGSGNGQFSKPYGLAVSESGEIYVADYGNNRVQVLTSSGTFVRSFGEAGSLLGKLSHPVAVAIGPAGDVWVTDNGNNRIEEFTAEGEVIGAIGNRGSGPGEFMAPDGITISGEYLYVADIGNYRVQEFTLSGRYVRQFGSKGTGNGQFMSPEGICTEPVSGDVYVGDSVNDRVEEFNAAGTFLSTFGKKGSGAGEFNNAEGLATNSAGDLYVADEGNLRVQELEPTYSTSDPAPEPPSVGSSAVTTIDYDVPLVGTGLPTMTKSEVAKWGQTTDIPAEATAVSPPDKPMGWPAKEYERASIYYRDAQGRTVNVYKPSGGISTTEYNAENEPIRTLSPDNRATALESSKSVEVAELLDTKNKYNGETKEEKEKEEKEKKVEPGARLLATWGPQHSVKQASGGEALPARDYTQYFYDEGSPAGETGEAYDLVTKVIGSAETASKETFDERITTTSYSGQNNLGWKIRKPTSIETDATGHGLNLTTTTLYNEETGEVMETRPPTNVTGESSAPVYSSKFGASGTGGGAFNVPVGMATDSSGNLWVADQANNRIEKFSSTGTFIEAIGFGVSNGEEKLEVCTASCQAGKAGAGSGQFNEPKGLAVNLSTGNLYIADTGNSRIQELSSAGAFIRKFGTEGTGQLKGPQDTVIDSSGNVWVADTGIKKIVEFSSEGIYLSKFGTEGTGAGDIGSPNDLVISWGDIYIADGTDERIDEFSTSGTFLKTFGWHVHTYGQEVLEVCTINCDAGTVGSHRGEFDGPYRIGVDPVSGDLYVGDHGNNRVQEFNPDGEFLATFGSTGKEKEQFENLKAVTVSASGSVYVSDAGNERIQIFVPPLSGYTGAHDSQTIYYTGGPNAMVAACGEHPEWVNLPCQTQPVAQPEDSKPNLPVTTTTYNMWDAPETATETVGTTTRTKKETFDNAGRGLTSEVSSTVGTALPKVVDEYNEETGALKTQSTTVGEAKKTMTETFDSLGQLVSYTDADGNTTKYTYNVDGQAKEVVYAIGKEEFSQKYFYNVKTKDLAELVVSEVGAFTATYDVEGRMTTQGYPDGLSAIYTDNSIGQAVGLEYKKAAHCGETCKWLSDATAPSIYGEMLSQTSTLASESYTYDRAGRLTEAQELPSGKTCVKREYAYDQDSNRTGITTGECGVEGGSLISHNYDAANRMIDPGSEYSAFGNTTKVSATDAGGNELTSAFYADGQLVQQTQNGEKLEYRVDPAGRTRETISTGTTNSAVVSHYSGPGEALSWTSEEAGKKWHRYITGIGGELAAIQASGEKPVLQLHDLQGDIIATASVNESETKLLSTYNSTEFGVPTTTKPPSYSWLGADGIGSQLPSGAIAQGGASYVPQLGRALQTEGIALPVPQNIPTPFISPALEPWVAETAAAAATYQTGLAEQARKALEDPAEECDEYLEGCGPDPEHGHNISDCRIWASWGYGLYGPPAVYGHFECTKEVEGFELEVAVQLVLYGGVTGGQYKMIQVGKEAWLLPHGEKSFVTDFSCNAHKWYRAWVWGRSYVGGLTYWTAEAFDGRLWECPETNANEGPADTEEKGAFSPEGGEGGDDGE